MSKETQLYIIEDTPSAQFLYKEILNTIDVTFKLFNSGEDFLDFISVNDAGKNSLIIMDIGLPGIDGVALLKKLKAYKNNWKKLPVIAVTAHVMTHEINHYKDQGFTQVIQKPIQVKSFKDLMQHYLQSILIGGTV